MPQNNTPTYKNHSDDIPIMVWNGYDEVCPYCQRILRGYEGLKVAYCKYCGGKIRR